MNGFFLSYTLSYCYHSITDINILKVTIHLSFYDDLNHHLTMTIKFHIK